MATVTRVAGTQANVGILYSPNCNIYLFTIKKADGEAIDLRSDDGSTSVAGVNSVLINSVVEQVVKEFNPLAYFITNTSAGTMHMVLDKNQNSASELQVQLRRIGLDQSKIDGSTIIGPNETDISASTVVAASSITVA